MSLPNIANEFSFKKIELPSGKNISVRGWLVKDEKELLFSIEQNPDQNQKINLIVSFLKNCVDNKKLFEELSEQDIKKICIETRKMSKGEVIDFRYTCSNCSTTIRDLKLDLNKHEKIKKFSNTPVKIGDELILNFKELDWKTSNEILNESENSSVIFSFKFLAASLNSVTYKGESFTEFTREEAENFLENLPSNYLDIIIDGFEKNVSLVDLEYIFKCPKCKHEEPVVFGDLFSFLVL